MITLLARKDGVIRFFFALNACRGLGMTFAREPTNISTRHRHIGVSTRCPLQFSRNSLLLALAWSCIAVFMLWSFFSIDRLVDRLESNNHILAFSSVVSGPPDRTAKSV
jgi:hypothetical protein